jgi:hypothetical protein
MLTLLLLWTVQVVFCVMVLISDLEINVLDATGDRILAGEELTKEPVYSICIG